MAARKDFTNSARKSRTKSGSKGKTLAAAGAFALAGAAVVGITQPQLFESDRASSSQLTQGKYNPREIVTFTSNGLPLTAEQAAAQENRKLDEHDAQQLLTGAICTLDPAACNPLRLR